MVKIKGQGHLTWGITFYLCATIMTRGKRYNGTNGLFELFFKSKPDIFTFRDCTFFKDKCINTNANGKSYKPTFPIHRNKYVCKV